MMIDNSNLPSQWQISDVVRLEAKVIAVTLWHRPEVGANASVVWPTVTGRGDSVAGALKDANDLLTDLGRLWERAQDD
jgi:hypothetical protein